RGRVATKTPRKKGNMAGWSGGQAGNFARGIAAAAAARLSANSGDAAGTQAEDATRYRVERRGRGSQAVWREGRAAARAAANRARPAATAATPQAFAFIPRGD